MILFGRVNLWIRILYSPPFPWNYPLLRSDQKAPEMLGKRVRPGNRFFKILWEGPPTPRPWASRLRRSRATGSAGRRSTDFNPVLSGKHAHAPKSTSHRTPMASRVVSYRIVLNEEIASLSPITNQLVAWHSSRTSVSDWRTFPVLRSTCS